MTSLSIKIIALLIFINIEVLKTEDYEDIQEESNISASVDSESNEVFNSSSREKPRRLIMFGDSNKTYDVGSYNLI